MSFGKWQVTANVAEALGPEDEASHRRTGKIDFKLCAECARRHPGGVIRDILDRRADELARERERLRRVRNNAARHARERRRRLRVREQRAEAESQSFTVPNP